MAILTAENDQLATEIARPRGQLTPDAAKAHAETEQQIEALRPSCWPCSTTRLRAPLMRGRGQGRERKPRFILIMSAIIVALEPGLVRMAKVVRATDQL